MWNKLINIYFNIKMCAIVGALLPVVQLLRDRVLSVISVRWMK